jgi:hypothetical protein
VNIHFKGRRNKLSLPAVTLVCVTGVNYLSAQFALKRSMRKIDFAKVLLVGYEYPQKLVDGIEFQQANNSKLDSINEYSRYCIYELWSHIETDYVLLIQADGYVIHPMKWEKVFESYDYIGAPWVISDKSYIDPFGNHIRVGNGGFSFRSLKLLKVPQMIDVPWEVNEGLFYKHMNYKLYSEDGNVCVHNRHIYESAGCRFAPLDIAMRFSIEQKVPEYTGQLTFGFHKRYPDMRTRITERVHWYLFKMKFDK